MAPLFAVLALASLPVIAMAQDRPAPESTAAIEPRAAMTATKWIAVAAHPLAAEAGREVLASGGSAADAAVAVQLVLNLVEPQSSGIGGGAFALYWSAAEGRLTSFDGRETAPMAADEDYWLDEDGAPLPFWEALVGGRSVGVPGTLKLLEELHARHGRIPWPELVAPAIRLAEEGFQVSPRLAHAIAEAEERGLDAFEATRAYFLDGNGTPLAAGSLLRNPDFARTLRMIAQHGSSSFYEGAIARDIVAAVRTDINPGIMTAEDLAAYEVIERDPVCIEYREFEICGMGPPSSGGLTAGQILGMLESFDLAEIGPGPEAEHLFIEASKLAFADRELYMADADFVDMPEGLLDADYLAERARVIDAEAVMETAEAGEPPWEDAALLAPDDQEELPATSHFVIVDERGDMISMTTTIEAGFGSRVMTNGFLLNNELTDFSFVPEMEGAKVANRVEGGKRPRSSMAPTVVLKDGEPVLLTGSPGGSAIIGYVAHSLIAMLDWEMDPQEAVDLPHVINRNGPTVVEAVPEADALAEALAAMGHEIERADLNSGLHAVRIGPEGLTGAVDPRREGRAAGD